MKRSSRWFVMMAVTALVAMLWASSLQAQGRRGGRGGFGGGGNLLSNEQVQKELDLVDDQIDDIRKIQEESRNSIRDLFSGLRDLSADERRSAFESLREKMQEQQEVTQKQIEGILLPHQRDRLQQINFQMSLNRGGTTGAIGAFGSNTVAEALGITEAQKEQLQEKSEEVEKELREKIEKARQEAIAELLSVLTPAQRKKYEELTGQPFVLERSQQRFGGFGGGDRGRGGQGGARGGGDRDRGGRDRGRPRRPGGNPDA